MNSAVFCIKHRVTTIMAFIMVAVFGILFFSSLPLALMPTIELPMAVVYTIYPNAGPSEIETLVTRPMEQACARVAGMDELQSYSSENTSMVMVTFSDETDLSEALVDLREKVDMIKSSLPDDAESPTVMQIDVDSMPVVALGLSGTDLSRLQTIAEDTYSPALERIDGVASVDIMGGVTNEVAVDTYSDKLAGYNLSVSYVAQMLGAENTAIPAGDVDNGKQTISVRTDGEFSSVEDIKNLLLPLPTGGTVRLDEIASVEMRAQDQSSIAKTNGKTCVLLSVTKQSGVNTLQVANRVKDALTKLKAENPSLDYSILMDQSDYIKTSVDSALENIILGVILAAIILLLFLRDWGATTVISISMPICIISVFLVMKMGNITMNMMSLGGIAMGVGMIVDNSIVVLENIFRYRSDGKSRYEACTEGTAEVALSVTASTLTTVAVFLPIGLASGTVGMLFREFVITIASLMFASLFIALTLVPVLSYGLLDRGSRKIRFTNKQDMADKPLMRMYKKLLHYFITRRKVAVLATFGMIALFGVSIAVSGFEMIPTMDQGSLSVNVSVPTGAELSDSVAIADRVVDIVYDTVPETETLYYYNGSTGMSTSASNSMSLTVDLVDLKKRTRSAEEIGNALRDELSHIAGAEISVSSAGMMDMSSMTGSAVSIELAGNNYDKLNETANRLVSEISKIPDAIEVSSSASDQTPRVNISINRANATRFGLNAATIGSAVRGQLSGQTATKLKMNGDEISVTVRGDERSAKSLDALRAISISTPSGGSVPLSLVADVNVELAPERIVRENQSRTVTVTASSRTDDTVGINQAVTALLADFKFPDGITLNTGGEMEEMTKSFGSLGYALIVGLGLVYFVLASQFESFLMPVIIMLILPVGLVGSLSGLPLTGNKISIPAFIGVIMLAGIVVNSSIILIDYIQTRRKRGEEKNIAIMNACPRRVRPVLMTTLTTILGLLPMAIGIGQEGSEMMKPMAIVMITGMIISTIVTLLFTPVYYSLVESLTERRKEKRRKKRAAKGDSDADEELTPVEAGC